MKLAAVIYCRFSNRPDAAESESNVFQLEKCREYCEQHGYTVKECHEDNALSGADADRPGLWAALEAIERGDALIVLKLDRLAREAFLAMTIERDVLKRGGIIVSASGEGTIDAVLSPEERLRFGILRLFADYERSVIGARTKAAMLRHQATGQRLMGSRPAIGKMIDPTKAHFCTKKNRAMPMLKDCPSEIADLEYIRSLAMFGNNAGEITRMLKAEGREFRGGHWKLATIKKIMRGTR